jgi:hypothetical protein
MQIASTMCSASWPSPIWTHGSGDAEQITVEHSYSPSTVVGGRW